MLIILRLSVLPHKHPHELLDSVVKERLAESFVSTEAAHLTATSFSVKLFLKNFFFLLNRLARSEVLLVSGRRILQR